MSDVTERLANLEETVAPIAERFAMAQYPDRLRDASLRDQIDRVGRFTLSGHVADDFGAATAAQAASQPLNAKLTSFSALANASGALTNNGSGTFSYVAYLTSAAADAAYQPLDADLTSIAALSTTSYGRSFLPLADAAAARTYIGGTSAGGTLFTAATAAAQRTALGLGTAFGANKATHLAHGASTDSVIDALIAAGLMDP